MLASNYDKDTLEDTNIIQEGNFGFRLLKSAVIYGANASGKSKFLEAFGFFRHFVIISSKDRQEGESIEVDPFRLSTETEDKPSEFEMVFLENNIQFRYGFEATRKKVTAEWLYYKPKTKEVELFYRENDEFDIHPLKFKIGRQIHKQGMVRDNALLLSTAAQFNEKLAIDVIHGLLKIKMLSGIYDHNYKGFTLQQLEDEDKREKILTLIKAADLGIDNLITHRITLDNLPNDLNENLKRTFLKELENENTLIFSKVETEHKKYDGNKNHAGSIKFLLDEDESAGTQKYFSISGPVLDVLETGSVLVVDELDTRLHPNLVKEIIGMFHSKTANPNNAQLIFNTHNTHLLSSQLMRRDQVWITQKDRYGEAELYSLADFKSDEVKKGENFEENYLRGKYGGIPILDRIRLLWESNDLDNEEDKQRKKESEAK